MLKTVKQIMIYHESFKFSTADLSISRCGWNIRTRILAEILKKSVNKIAENSSALFLLWLKVFKGKKNKNKYSWT